MLGTKFQVRSCKAATYKCPYKVSQSKHKDLLKIVQLLQNREVAKLHDCQIQMKTKKYGNVNLTTRAVWNLCVKKQPLFGKSWIFVCVLQTNLDKCTMTKH